MQFSVNAFFFLSFFKIWLLILVPGSEEDKNPFEDQYSAAQCAGDDSFLYHGRCYTFYSDKKTWAEARKFCKNKGRDLKLPVPMDTFEGARLNYESYLNGEHTEFWTDVWYNKVSDFDILIFCALTICFNNCLFSHLHTLNLLLFYFIGYHCYRVN